MVSPRFIKGRTNPGDSVQAASTCGRRGVLGVGGGLGGGWVSTRAAFHAGACCGGSAGFPIPFGCVVVLLRIPTTFIGGKKKALLQNVTFALIASLFTYPGQMIKPGYFCMCLFLSISSLTIPH